MGNTQSKMLPTDADFDRVEYKPALKWAKLLQGKYSIKGKRELSTQYGDAMILSLTPFEEGETVEVWAPNRLMRQLQDKPDAKYLRNNGLRVSSKNKTHKFHSFDLI